MICSGLEIAALQIIFVCAAYSHALEKTSTLKDQCSLPPETGPCRAAFPRWFYNTTSHSCEQFIYGGCHGNENNFKKKESCHKKCSHKESKEGQEALLELISESLLKTNRNRAQEGPVQLEQPKIKAEDLMDFRTKRETSDISVMGEPISSVHTNDGALIQLEHQEIKARDLTNFRTRRDAPDTVPELDDDQHAEDIENAKKALKKSLKRRLKKTYNKGQILPQGQVGKPGSKETLKPGPKETLKAEPKETLKPGPKKTLKPGPKETLKPGPSPTLKAEPKETLKPGPKETLKPGPKETLKPVPKETLKPGPSATPTLKGEPKETLKPGPKETLKPGPKETLKPGPKEALKPGPSATPTQKAEPKETLKPRPKETLKPGPKETLKPGPKEALKPGPKETLKPRPKETLKPGPKETLKARTTEPKEEQKDRKHGRWSNDGESSLGVNQQQTSHFAGFFLASIVAVFVVYGVYHNRQKIIAIVIEGRNGNGRERRGKYNRLETTVEEAMPTMKSTNTAYVY